jgi:hypothetical protein
MRISAHSSPALSTLRGSELAANPLDAKQEFLFPFEITGIFILHFFTLHVP